jgi:predicted GH43/DUF377 family glycosyl hydrolase
MTDLRIYFLNIGTYLLTYTNLDEVLTRTLLVLTVLYTLYRLGRLVVIDYRKNEERNQNK